MREKQKREARLFCLSSRPWPAGQRAGEEETGARLTREGGAAIQVLQELVGELLEPPALSESLHGRLDLLPLG